MADPLQHANAQGGLPPSFSVNVSNCRLPGQQVQPIALSPSSGLDPLYDLDGLANSGSVARGNTFDAVMNMASSHPLKQQADSTLARAKSGAARLQATPRANNNFSTPYNSSSKLATRLCLVARLIAGYQQMGMRRQVFFVEAGGRDTHDNQTPRLNLLLADLDRSLSDFQDTLSEVNMSDSVTTFTASDFGRTLTTNSDGSDHGWGGHYIVMGGAVNGGRMLDQLPNLAVGSVDDTGTKGRVIPTLSISMEP